jgi:alanyl-tRNA synthetase
MKGSEIREKFLKYFETKGHTRVASSSLVPANDPTLLFSNAGMNQFKECFLGTEDRGYKRATTSQKCLRISGKHNDFENVGVTARHHTFFEMLGNFSFGDYFKTDAIKFGWEFVTSEVGLDKERLWVTIFEEDDEAEKLWKEHTDVKPERILRMDEKDNFWSMGDTGPCGPCSEIHYYLGDDVNDQSEEEFRKDDGTYMEIWNLVFMQFNRSADGTMDPLPKPSVDTGMGFERVAAIVQGKKANYDCDLLRDIIAVCEKESGFSYDGSSYELRDLKTDKEYARDVAMRVIADHSRAAAFLIADGVHPGSDGRGYVLRRIIRRAIRHGRVLEFSSPILEKTTAKVVSLMKDHYPELVEKADLIRRVVAAEESKFHETLDSGLQVLQREIEKVPSGQPLSGEVAFLLHDTYGFPLDLTQDALKAHRMSVDEEGFHAAMERQRARSRDDRKSQKISFASTKIEGAPSTFLGYEKEEAEGELTFMVAGDDKTSISTGESVALVFAQTPFYAESGGQVGDSGTISFDSCKLNVLDTQKATGGYIVHHCEVAEGELSSDSTGQVARLEIDRSKRQRIKHNHSATHIVHAGLRKFLGEHVKQAGSRVDENTLRFDYSHFETLTDQQLNDLQSFVNTEIRNNYEVSIKEMAIDDAREAGAMALFGEKYGDVVRVVEIGPNSLELCGGTHVERSGDIGVVLVASDSSISAGVRRIECWSGAGAWDQIWAEHNERSQIAALLKSDASELPEKIDRLQQKIRSLEKDLESAKSKLASAASGDLVDRARVSPSGVKVIAESVEGADANTLRGMVDRLRLKLGSGVVALASAQGPNAILVTGITSDLADTLNAGTLVREAAKVSGGKGGGRGDFAQAGGLEADKLSQALECVFKMVA